jgi:hypothetical protein
MAASDEDQFEPARSASTDANALVADWLAMPRHALESLESQIVSWIEQQVNEAQLVGGESPSRESNDSNQVAELLAENQRLTQENAELEARVAGSAATREQHELQQVYEMACQEIRELRAELANQPQIPEYVEEDDQTLDWESAKKKMLAELAAEDGLAESEQKAIDRVIEKTNAAIAEKDAEIERLQLRLEVTGADKAIETMLDSDELVTQERERLATLQRDWEEKLRKAEIEISIERAMLAREKAEQDEQIRQLEERLDETQTDPNDDGKPNRGRWLARLGLADD